MEIKATLQKPYTDKERMDFIVTYNYNQGYEIKETETALEAWGYTEKEKKKQERERLALLNMTGADVERAIYKVKGIDFDDILEKVKDNPTIDEKALKIEFKANNFFRGNPYIEQVGSLLGCTSKMLDKFFDTKDYHYLTKKTLTINATPSNSVVTINGVETTKVEVPYDTDVEYLVELEGYTSYYGSINLIEDKVIDVELKEVKNEETNTTIDDSANE